MAKLKDLGVTITPKLDLRKTQKLSQKISEIFDKSLGNLGNIGSNAGKAMATANQGLHVLEQLKTILNSTNSIVENLVSKSDALTYISTTGKESADQIHRLFSRLDAASSLENTQDLYQTFLSKMNGKNSAGINDNGQHNAGINDNAQNSAGINDNAQNSVRINDNAQKSASMNSFLTVINELQRFKNIIHSQVSQTQKNDAIKNESSLIEKYFGTAKTKEIDNFIGAFQNTHNNLKLNTGDNDSGSVSNNGNVLAVQQGLAILEEQKKHNTFLAAKSTESVQVQNSINQVEQMIKTLVTEASTFINQFQKVFDVIIPMVQNVTKMVTGVMNVLSFNKSPTEESFQKDLSNLLDKRDSLMSKMDTRNTGSNDKHMEGDQKSMDNLYGKFKRLFEHGNPDATKYAADDETLRRIVTDKNYRGNF